MGLTIISGGQAGADLGGMAGAKAAGVACRIRTYRGFKPIGRQALPLEYPVEYLDIRESLDTADKLRARTFGNVQYAQGVVVFIHQPLDKDTRGSWLTVNECIEQRKPVLLVNCQARWLVNLTLLRTFLHAFETVMVAGQRYCSEELVSKYIQEALR